VTAAMAARVDTAAVSPYKLASLLLQYPTVALFDGLEHIDAAVESTPGPCREPFRRFVSWLHATSSEKVAEHYVETFDLRRRCTLYLTYYRYGDTRKRRMSMLAFKAACQEVATGRLALVAVIGVRAGSNVTASSAGPR